MTRNIKKMPTAKDDSDDMVVGYTLWQDSKHGECLLAGMLPKSDPSITYNHHIEEIICA